MEPSRAPFESGWEWFKQGAGLFFAQPMMLILIHVLYIIVMLFIQFIPFIGMFAAYLITPALLAGILYATHRIAQRDEIEAGFLFQVFNDKSKLHPMLTLGGLYMVSVIIIMMVVFAIMFAVAGPLFFELLMAEPEAARELFEDNIEVVFVMMGAMLVSGFIMMALLLMGFFYAIPLVMFSTTEPFDAIKSSIRACWRNMWPLTLFGVLHIFFVFIGSLPLLLGLFIVMPITFAAWYASFREIYPDVDEEEPSTPGVMHV